MEPTIVELAENFKAELANANAECVKLKADLAAAESLAGEAEKATAAVKAELEAVKAELSAAKESASAITTAREKAEFDRDAAKAEQVKAEQALADLKAKVSSNPAFAHASAGRPALKVEGPSKVLTMQEFKALPPQEQAALARGGVTISD